MLVNLVEDNYSLLSNLNSEEIELFMSVSIQLGIVRACTLVSGVTMLML